MTSDPSNEGRPFGEGLLGDFQKHLTCERAVPTSKLLIQLKQLATEFALLPSEFVQEFVLFVVTSNESQ